MKTRVDGLRRSHLLITYGWSILLSCVLLIGLGGPRSATADAPPGIIETVAGSHNGDGLTAVNAIVDPRGLATCQRVSGARPDLYIADGKGHRIRRVDGVTGVVSTFAGTGAAGFSGDGGPATQAQVSFPLDVACDANGNVYVADGWSNRRVRKIDTSGRIDTVAGNGQHDFSGDNIPAPQAAMSVYALALDASGNIYIADADSRRVRKVATNGIITTVAGTGANGYARDGQPATQQALGFPSGVAVDTLGRLYIADYGNKVIYRVVHGVISVFAGDYIPAFGGDGGPATSAHLFLPNRVAVDGLGTLVILDHGNNRVRRVDTAGIITTVAGNGTIGSTGDGGPGTQASLFPLRAIATDEHGNVYIGSSVSTSEPWSYDNRVRLLDSAGTIDTVVGIGENGDGGSALDAVIDPQGVTTDRDPRYADLYIADGRNNQVRKVDAVTGVVSTVAGTGEAGFSGDGAPATAARLWGPSDVALDANGNLYIADQNNKRVRRIDPRGYIATVAGNGAFGYNGDGGLAINAALSSPSGIAVDDAGNLYIADKYNYRVRKVSAQGIVSTIAGNGTYNLFDPPGTNGPAIQAPLGVPTDAVVASDGSVYIAEFGTHRVRRVRPDGIIVAVAGNGNYGASGDGGPAVNALLNGPYRLALDAERNLYIADANNRVRRVDGSGIEVQAAMVQAHAAGSSRTAMMQAETDATGQFALHDVPGGEWRIQPRKIGGAEKAVNAVDAVRAMRAATRNLTLTAAEQLACDVSGDGKMTLLDAHLILRHTVGIVTQFPVALMCDSDWMFMPEPAALSYQEVVQPRVNAGTCLPGAVAYHPLRADAGDQDFSAMAFGDCAGDWQPSAAAASRSTSQVEMGRLHRLRGRVRVTIRIPVRDTFHALDVRLEYDRNTLRPSRVVQLRDAQLALMAVNADVPGSVAVSLANAEPMRGGRLLNVEFEVTGSARPAATSVRLAAASAARVQ